MEQTLNSFRQFLEREERAEGTIEKYISDVRQFMKWNVKNEITKEIVIEWKHSLMNKQYAVSSINSMLASLHCYLRFLNIEEYKVKYLKVQRKLFVKKIES